MQQIPVSPALDAAITNDSSRLNEEPEGTEQQNTENSVNIPGAGRHPDGSSSLHTEETAMLGNVISEVQHGSEATAIRPPSTPRLTNINISRNINIAPRPGATEDDNGNEITPQEQYDHEHTKLELRKIRKREAAARSYRKNLAEKPVGKMI